MDKKSLKNKIDFSYVLKRLLLIVLAVYICVSLISQQFKLTSLESAEKELDAEFSLEEKRKKELDDEKALLGTDEYYERAARERLGFTKKNEKVFIDINK
ncbi:MAG: hypothetical protein E7398_06265 [Ruminococcaceae bacterium]|nr:hypothetical protein [Oscillospiraceae bacterium]